MDACLITIDGGAVVEECEMEPGLRAISAFLWTKKTTRISAGCFGPCRGVRNGADA